MPLPIIDHGYVFVTGMSIFLAVDQSYQLQQGAYLINGCCCERHERHCEGLDAAFLHDKHTLAH